MVLNADHSHASSGECDNDNKSSTSSYEKVSSDHDHNSPTSSIKTACKRLRLYMKLEITAVVNNDEFRYALDVVRTQTNFMTLGCRPSDPIFKLFYSDLSIDFFTRFLTFLDSEEALTSKKVSAEFILLSFIRLLQIYWNVSLFPCLHILKLEYYCIPQKLLRLLQKPELQPSKLWDVNTRVLVHSTLGLLQNCSSHLLVTDYPWEDSAKYVKNIFQWACEYDSKHNLMFESLFILCQLVPDSCAHAYLCVNGYVVDQLLSVATVCCNCCDAYYSGEYGFSLDLILTRLKKLTLVEENCSLFLRRDVMKFICTVLDSHTDDANKRSGKETMDVTYLTLELLCNLSVVNNCSTLIAPEFDRIWAKCERQPFVSSRALGLAKKLRCRFGEMDRKQGPPFFTQRTSNPKGTVLVQHSSSQSLSKCLIQHLKSTYEVEVKETGVKSSANVGQLSALIHVISEHGEFTVDHRNTIRYVYNHKIPIYAVVAAAELCPRELATCSNEVIVVSGDAVDDASFVFKVITALRKCGCQPSVQEDTHSSDDFPKQLSTIAQAVVEHKNNKVHRLNHNMVHESICELYNTFFKESPWFLFRERSSPHPIFYKTVTRSDVKDHLFEILEAFRYEIRNNKVRLFWWLRDISGYMAAMGDACSDPRQLMNNFAFYAANLLLQFISYSDEFTYNLRVLDLRFDLYEAIRDAESNHDASSPLVVVWVLLLPLFEEDKQLVFYYEIFLSPVLYLINDVSKPTEQCSEFHCNLRLDQLLQCLRIMTAPKKNRQMLPISQVVTSMCSLLKVCLNLLEGSDRSKSFAGTDINVAVELSLDVLHNVVYNSHFPPNEYKQLSDILPRLEATTKKYPLANISAEALRHHLGALKPLPQQITTCPTKSTEAGSLNMKLMLSYQHESKGIVLSAHQQLTKLEFKCWIDIEHQEGSFLLNMVDAVDEADVVIFFVCKLSHASVHCRTELRSAYNQHKPIIVLALAEDFKRAYWPTLVELCHGWFEVFDENALSSTMPELRALLLQLGKK